MDHLLAWLPGAPDPLIETRDGGAQWQALPGRAPAEITHVFSTNAGWWLTSANAGVLFYDEDTAKWNSMRFVAAPPPAGPARTRSRQTSRHRQPKTTLEIPSASDISAVLTVGARVFISAPEGLWSGAWREKILRPVVVAGAATELNAQDFSREVLWMVAGGRALRSLDGGTSWIPVPLELTAREPGTGVYGTHASEKGIRWVYAPQVATDEPQQTAEAAQGGPLVGATSGLYHWGVGHETGAAWRLVQNGLPAAEPIAYAFRKGVCIVAMRTGGLYVSRDAWHTWERLDSPAAPGPFTGVALTGDGFITAATRTEGLLRIFPAWSR
jgi:hypothetical protein